MNRRFPALALAALLLAFAAIRPAPAADSEFVGIMALIVEQEVADDLGLSVDEYKELFEWVDDRELGATDLVLSLKDEPRDLRRRLAQYAAESERLGLAKLTPEQQAKLRRIQMKRNGLVSLAEEHVQASIKLTDEQKELIAELLNARMSALDTARDGEEGVIKQDYERQLAAMLTREQRTAFDELAGGEEVAAAEADDNFPAEIDVAPVDRGERPIVPVAGETELRFNFRFAPWKTVLEWFAEQSNYSLEMAATPPGTLNYTDGRVYTPAEAIDLLNGLLLFKGYTIVRHERMLTVINLDDGIPPNLIETVAVKDLDDRGKFELVSCLFRLEHLTSEEAENEIKKLLGPQGSIVVLPKSNAIHVTETGGRLRVIRDLLLQAEKPETLAAAKIQQITLEHAPAEEVLGVVRQLLRLPEDRNAAADGSLSIAVDALGMRLFVTGEDESVQKVRDIVKLVDVPDGLGAVGPLSIETPQLEVYAISNADPESVLKVLQTIMAEEPGVRLDIDPKTGNLVALARPTQHQTIKATIDQMQSDARVAEVLQLRIVDPQLAVLSINRLFGSGSGGEEGAVNPRAPIVDADPTRGLLLLRATEAQIAQIRELLEKMGETWEGEDTQYAAAQRGNVRMIPLTGAAARNAMDQLETIWPTMRKNKIRVVRPSAAIRELRTGEDNPEESQPHNGGQPPRLDDLNSLFRLFEIQPRTPQAAPQPKPENDTPKADDPEPADEASKSGDRQAALPASRRRFFRLASDQFVLAQADENQPADADDKQPTDEKKPAEESDEPVSRPGAEIIVAPGPGGIMIASDDLDALDDFEQLLQTLSNQAALGGREYTVFYLKYARAEVAAELLNEILGGGGGGGAPAGGGGGLFGDIASAALGDSGGGLVGSLLGLGGGAGGAISTSGTVTMVADSRLNALVVQAAQPDMDIVEQLLEIIDQEASPEDVQTFARPRLIPVFYTSAAEIANVVREVYSSRIGGAASSNRQRQPSPEEFIRALRGGRGGGGNSRSAREEEQEITIGVDAQQLARRFRTRADVPRNSKACRATRPGRRGRDRDHSRRHPEKRESRTGAKGDRQCHRGKGDSQHLQRYAAHIRPVATQRRRQQRHRRPSGPRFR